MSGPKHFLDLDALETATLRDILDRAAALKAAAKGSDLLAGRVLVMIFEHPSTRTRVSFDVGMHELGGHSLVLNRDDLHLGRGESVADTARVFSRYADAIVIRAADHETLAELAAHAEVPVINGMTDRTHPCQLMADVMTFEEHRGPISGSAIAWSGDGNNVATSWIHAAVRFEFELRLACPEGLGPPTAVLDRAAREGGRIVLAQSAEEAVAGADCVVTDTWESLGKETRPDLGDRLVPYRVDARLMALARPDAIFMHCLPAHRGREVSAEVIDGPQTVVWDEAANRLHAQKGVLAWCLS
jgi:ornithine carbamoyltransferase